MVEVCHKYGTAVKVILETDALTHEEIAKATRVAVEAGADFVKSSTGFYTGGPCVGATEEVVAIMMENTEGKAKVKGSGCIRTREHFLKLHRYGNRPDGNRLQIHSHCSWAQQIIIENFRI